MADAAGAAASGGGDDVKLPDPVILHSDMAADARAMCLAKAAEALRPGGPKVEKDQAQYIKQALEQWNGALWHVIVGTSFGASVAHETRCLLLFRIGKVHVLCFQSFDEASLVMDNKKTAFVPRAVGGKKADEDEAEGGEA